MKTENKISDFCNENFINRMYQRDFITPKENSYLYKNMKLLDLESTYQFIIYLHKISKISDEFEQQALKDKVVSFFRLYINYKDSDYSRENECRKEKCFNSKQNSNVNQLMIESMRKSPFGKYLITNFENVELFFIDVFNKLSPGEVTVEEVFGKIPELLKRINQEKKVSMNVDESKKNKFVNNTLLEDEDIIKFNNQNLIENELSNCNESSVNGETDNISQIEFDIKAFDGIEKINKYDICKLYFNLVKDDMTLPVNKDLESKIVNNTKENKTSSIIPKSSLCMFYFTDILEKVRERLDFYYNLNYEEKCYNINIVNKKINSDEVIDRLCHLNIRYFELFIKFFKFGNNELLDLLYKCICKLTHNQILKIEIDKKEKESKELDETEENKEKILKPNNKDQDKVKKLKFNKEIKKMLSELDDEKNNNVKKNEKEQNEIYKAKYVTKFGKSNGFFIKHIRKFIEYYPEFLKNCKIDNLSNKIENADNNDSEVNFSNLLFKSSQVCDKSDKITYILMSIIEISLSNNENISFITRICQLQPNFTAFSLSKCLQIKALRPAETLIKSLKYYDEIYYPEILRISQLKSYAFYFQRLMNKEIDVSVFWDIFKNLDVVMAYLIKDLIDKVNFGESIKRSNEYDNDTLDAYRKINFFIKKLMKELNYDKVKIEDLLKKQLRTSNSFTNKDEIIDTFNRNKNLICNMTESDIDEKLKFKNENVKFFGPFEEGCFKLLDQYREKILLINSKESVNKIKSFIAKLVTCDIFDENLSDNNDYSDFFSDINNNDKSNDSDLIVTIDTETIATLTTFDVQADCSLIQLSFTTISQIKQLKNYYINKKEKNTSKLANCNVATVLLNFKYINENAEIFENVKDVLSVIFNKVKFIAGFDLRYDTKHLLKLLNLNLSKKFSSADYIVDLCSTSSNLESKMVKLNLYKEKKEKKQDIEIDKPLKTQLTEDNKNEINKDDKDKPKNEKFSLKQLVYDVLSVKICKQCQMSNWEVDELLPQQIHYASLDSYIIVLLLSYLIDI
jgi:hypothetical protein